MSIIAGDIKEIVIDHDELGQLILDCKSGEDGTFMPGGYKSNDDDSNISANLNRIDQLNAYPWSLEATIARNQDDIDALQALTENPQEGKITVTFADLSVRSGKGKPVGDLADATQAGTISLKIGGSGRFAKLT